MDKKDALELYKSLRTQETNWLTLHRNDSQRYLTIIVAIFAVAVGAAYQLKDHHNLMIAVVVGPILNTLLCLTAIMVCKESYRRYLEEVTIEIKLESIIGLNSERAMPEGQFNHFPIDKHYIPNSWLEGRAHQSATDFVRVHMADKSSRYVSISFLLLFVANLVFAGFLLLVFFGVAF